MLKLGSLFDGIGGWPLAAIKFGIKPVWSSEIAPFPQEITKTHFPSMQHLGDITKINGAEIDPVDIICMGSPCQDLSTAGKREGLDGERSGLFRRAVDIVRQMRNATNGQYPRFIVWENVPGAFSSNKGADFRTVLEEITETKIPIPASGRWATAGMVRSDSCEVAWRVLDAQYWGVPQRRKRIFLVADFTGQCAGEILFKPESMCGYSAESRGKREGISESTQDSLGTTGASIAYSFDSLSSNSMKSKNPHSGCRSVEAYACGGYSNYQLSNIAATHARCVAKQADVDLVIELVGGGSETILVPYQDKIGCLNARDYKGVGNQYVYEDKCIVENKHKVRRLTPTECERLQGLTDGYTLIDDKKCSDSARYKALGNGMAQPCPDFIMDGIASVFRRDNQ